MKTVLITGCAGLIGSNLLKKLLEDKSNYIIGVDNLFTGKIENIKEFLSNENFEFIRHDVIFPLFLEIDEIYHLASPASPIYYQKNPIKTIKTNILGTMNMLGLAKRVGAKILFSSTSEVYGDPEIHPQTENYWGHVNPVGKRSCYDEGKRVSETLMMEYRYAHNVHTKIVRIFNTYGPNMAINDGRVMSNFIVQALKNEDITIYGTGEQTRSFCYVDDMVNGIIKMMNSEYEVSGPINLGSEYEISILELANKIINKIESQSKIVYKELPEDDPIRRRPDIRKAKEILKWEPKIQFEIGLENTINYFRSIL